MKRASFVVSLFSVGLLVGCANQPTDPREGGLLGGITGLQTGAYDARVREREDRLESMRAIEQQLAAERTDLDAQRATRQQQVAAERRRLAELNTEVASLSKTVDELAAQHGTGDERVRELQGRIQALQGDMKRQQSGLDALEGMGAGGGADPAVELRRRQLEDQRKALQREYELLLQLSLELAR
jgi:chromosome segregation ATPase